MTFGLGVAGRFAATFIPSKLTPLVIVGSIALGAFAVAALPREEEPQIIVPMVDVFVELAGAKPCGSRAADHATDGEAAVGGAGSRIHLFNVQPWPIDGDRAVSRW